MSNAFIGADLEALRSMATAFDSASAELESSRTLIGGIVGALSQWQGDDFAGFTTGWHANSISLATVAKAISDAARVLERNIDEQADVSGVKGGFGSGDGSTPWLALPNLPDWSDIARRMFFGPDGVPPSAHDLYQMFNNWRSDTAAGNVAGSLLNLVPGFSSGLEIADAIFDPTLSDEDRFFSISAGTFKAVGEVGVAVGAALVVGGLIAGAPVAVPALIAAAGVGAIFAGTAMAANIANQGNWTWGDAGNVVVDTVQSTVVSGMAGIATGMAAAVTVPVATTVAAAAATAAVDSVFELSQNALNGGFKWF